MADKFNLTLSVAAVHIEAHFMDRTPAADFNDLLRQAPRRKTDFRGLPEYHYSVNLLSIPDSRLGYLPPDRGRMLKSAFENSMENKSISF